MTASASASKTAVTTTASGVSITKMGPMTRSRKRKMQDNISSVSITPLANSANSNPTAPKVMEIVTVTKRERTMDYFPQAATSSEPGGMQYCATARAVVVTPTVAASTWTPTVAAEAAAATSAASRSVTITID